ncbi:MAG TPA: branched-chain amino acid ABC transporter permease, partial [Burkholderiaceae bacterium]
MTTATSLNPVAAPGRFARVDWMPLALAPLLALLALPLIDSLPTWITLTVAGLAMGMIIFIIASGLTLIFGLMDVLNFGHGLFIAIGGFVAVTVLGRMPEWTAAEHLGLNLAALAIAMVAAMAAAGLAGWVFE